MKEVDALISDFKNNKYAPVYFLQGDESYYIDLVSDYVEEHALDESAKGFNQIIMYGRDISVQDVINNARRFPMMSERQVVIVKEAQSIQDFSKETGQKLLEDYIKNPTPSTILVFCYKYKKLDGRKALTRLMLKNAIVVTADKIRDWELPRWIQDYVESRGHKITDKAVRMLAENIGTDLEKVSNEVSKILINFKDDSVHIDDQLVDKYVGINKDYNTFELQKALVYRDVLKANKIINYFGDNPKEHNIIPIVAFLFSFYTKVLSLHAHKATTVSDIKGILRKPDFVAREYMNAMKNYPLPVLINCIHALREADKKSKGIGYSNLNQGQILKELVYKLLH
jgi:DNA polymerase-3 subunit delta